MRALLRAEMLKLLKQSKTYYAIAAVFLIEGIILMTAYYQGATILELLLDNLRQSFYFEGNLLNGNLILYIVLNSLWFNVPLILMIITSSLVTDEYKDGTLQTVMLQATKKWKFILAKYIAAILFTLFVIAFMAATTFAMAYGLFGDGDLVVYINTLNFFESADAFQRICLSFGAGAISMVFYNVISVTLAVFIKESARTWLAAAFFLILCNLLLKVDLGSEILNRFFFPKLIDTWQYFFYYEPNYNDIIWNTAMLLLYTFGFAGIGIYIFNKKDIE